VRLLTEIVIPTYQGTVIISGTGIQFQKHPKILFEKLFSSHKMLKIPFDVNILTGQIVEIGLYIQSGIRSVMWQP